MTGESPASFVELLTLDQVAEGRFRAPAAPQRVDSHLFGGQIVAQALAAAALTAPELPPHSLHAYFVHAGRSDEAAEVTVRRLRDGRAAAMREASFMQGGRLLARMLASFRTVGTDDLAVEYTAGEGLPGPAPTAGDGDGPDSRNSAVYVETAGREPPQEPRTRWRPPRTFWTRMRERLPDDPVVHACAVAFIADMGSGFAALSVEGLPEGGPSIDHAVWFHRAVRADEWLHNDRVPVSVSAGRGVYRGTIHDARGRLGATMAQEMVLRVRRRDSGH